MEIRKQLYEVPVASTDFFTVYRHSKGLRYDYHRDDKTFRSGLNFKPIRSCRFLAESLCNVWHSKGCYDTLVEIEGSPWAKELHDRHYENVPFWKIQLRHFMIYLDGGCHEFIADSWEALPEEEGPWIGLD